MINKTKPRIIAGTPPDGTAAPFQKFWNVANVSTDEAEITMYGDVCSSQPVDWWTGEPLPGLFITPEGFLEDLAAIRGKSKITVKLNSCGGDLYTGIAIHNALKGLTGHKTVVVEGIAASAASVIMCAGDEVQVYPGSMVMIHCVAGLFFDYMTITDLKQAIKGFDAAEKAIAEIYSEKTGTDAETLRSMMTKETWMVGQEAVDKGFANALLKDNSPEMVISADRKVLLVAGIRHDVSSFNNLPGNIPVSNSIPAVPTAGNNKTMPTGQKATGERLSANANGGKEGGKSMKTLEELRAAFPELVAQAENEAVKAANEEVVKAERERIREIEDIAVAVGNDTLVRDAKYGDNPCTAQDLALRAMKEQSKLGATHLANLKADYTASGAGEVGAAPNGGESGETEKTPDEQIENARAEVKNLLGKKKEGN